MDGTIFYDGMEGQDISNRVRCADKKSVRMDCDGVCAVLVMVRLPGNNGSVVNHLLRPGPQSKIAALGLDLMLHAHMCRAKSSMVFLASLIRVVSARWGTFVGTTPTLLLNASSWTR